MKAKITALIIVLLGASVTSLIVFMISLSLFDIVQEPELTEIIKYSAVASGILFLPYVSLCFSIKCGNCGERLMFKQGEEGDAKGWDDLLKNLLFNKKVLCQHCSHANDFNN